MFSFKNLNELYLKFLFVHFRRRNKVDGENYHVSFKIYLSQDLQVQPRFNVWSLPIHK